MMGPRNSRTAAALVISRFEGGREAHIDMPLDTTTPDAIDAAVRLRGEKDQFFLSVNGKLIALDRDAPVAAIVKPFLRSR